jgi:flavin-binding protein dodecin
MSVGRVVEISAVSAQGFEAAVKEGINRATSTLRNVEGCWVKDMNVLIEDGSIVGYKVNLAVSFVLENAQGGTGAQGLPEDALEGHRSGRLAGGLET